MSGTKGVQSPSAYRRPEEPANFITCAIAALLSFVGLVFLLLKIRGTATLPVAFSVSFYGVIGVAVFFAEAISFVMPRGSRARTAIERADRCSVCVLAVCVFVPVFLIGLGGGAEFDFIFGCVMLAVAATSTVAAIAVNIADPAESKLASLVLYVVAALAMTARIDTVYYYCGGKVFYTIMCGFSLYVVAVAFKMFVTSAALVFVGRVFVASGAAVCFVAVYCFIL